MGLQSLEIQRPQVVMYRLGIGRDTLYRLVKQNKLPKPVKLTGGRASGWYKRDVDAYLEALRPAEEQTSPQIVRRRARRAA
jgi:excisionase family DNA binding protein